MAVTSLHAPLGAVVLAVICVICGPVPWVTGEAVLYIVWIFVRSVVVMAVVVCVVFAVGRPNAPFLKDECVDGHFVAS